MYQHVLVTEQRLAELRSEAADARQARQAVRTAKQERVARRSPRQLTERARRWTMAA